MSFKYYGLLSSRNVDTKLARCIKLAGGRAAVAVDPLKQVSICPFCGGIMAFRFMVRRHRVKNKRGGRKMRTLEEIREENKRKDMLFTGMESKCVSLPPEVIKEGKNFFNNYVKPTVRRVIKRQLLKGNL